MIKYAEIAATVLIVAAVVSILITALNPNSPPTQSKVPATDYFAFSDLGAEYVAINGTDEMIKIKFVHLTLTPVGGNATGLHLEVSGFTDPLAADLYYPEITNGTSKSIEVTLRSMRLIKKTGTTFPLPIRLYCKESEGYVTLQIPEANVFAL